MFLPTIPTYLKPPMYTAILALIMIVSVPRKDIRRLIIYGIMFGALMDLIALTSGKLLGVYNYINFFPLGYWVVPFFSPISWAVFYIMYFYFLPKPKPLMYIYIASGIGFSTFFAELLFNSGIMVIHPKLFSETVDKFLYPVMVFMLWVPFSTWGFLRLTNHFEGQKQERKVYEKKKLMGLKFYPQPARKIEKEDGKVKLIKPKKL